MIKNLKKFLFVLFCISLNQSFAQFSKIEVNSKILSGKDSSAIGFVHIINLETNHGVISDLYGQFSFTINETDSLKFSVIGYETLKLEGKQIPPIIYLKPKNYELEEYIVLPYKDYEEFKQAFINLAILDSSLKINPSIFMLDRDMFLYQNKIGFGITINGGISAIYEYFSKRGRSKIRYEELLVRDRYKAYLATKFNNLIVAKAVPLKEKFAIETFMLFCDFTDEFIEKSNEYEIIKEIQHCYAEYKNQE